jgi:predicted lipoprotein with Yx(FWY)xxD motif
LVVMVALAGTALAAAACGSSSGGSGTSGTTATTAAPGGSGTTGTTGTTGGGGSATVKSAKVGSVGTVLVDAKGFTLYHYSPDHNGVSTCTGTCAQTWPPLTVASGTKPSGMSGLGTTKRSDGTTQVTFKGEPLYTYSGDSAAGQANGQGIGGVWHVVLASGSGTSGSTTSSSSAGGYGY